MKGEVEEKEVGVFAGCRGLGEGRLHAREVITSIYYMAVSQKDWKQPNRRI